MTEHRWQGYSHEELFKRIHAGPGPAASHTSMERWNGVAAALSEINDDLHRGIANSGAKWQGKAADVAQAGMNPLAAWADNARTGADVMRYSAELQADHISKARSDMPPPVKVTSEQPGALVAGLTHLFGGQTDHEKQEAAQDAAERKAREVMTTYASSTTSNTSTLGQFTQPPQLQMNVTNTGSASGGGVGTAGVWGVGPNGTRGGYAAGRTSSSRSSTAPPPQRTASPSAPPPGTSTRTSGVSAPAAAAKGVHGTTSVSSTTATGAPSVTGTAGVGVPGQRSGKSSSTSQQEQQPADATMASGMGVAPVMGAPTASTASHTPSASVMGPQGTVGASNNDQVHRRAVPMAPSFDPFGGMGARTGEEEEDKLHKAADYLRETDDIYGVGSYTAPVIGEGTTD